MKIIQVIDVGGGTRSQFFLSLGKKTHPVKLKETANRIFDFLFLHFRFFICLFHFNRMVAEAKWWPLAPLALYGKASKHTHTSRLMFMLFDQKYENIWSFIAVHDVRCRHTTSPVNESILINAYEIHVEGTREPLKLFLEMRWSRASCTHHYAYAHKQTARNACT